MRLRRWRIPCGVCLAGILGLPLVRTAEQPRVPSAVVPLPKAHAHNDYEHSRPLFDALEHGFGSVEADIFLVGNELLVGHSRKDLRPGRTLEKLYLEPLRQRVKANGGRVYPGGPTVFLLVDVKSDSKPTYAALSAVLARYADILSVTQGGRFEPNAVTVVISGNCDRAAISAQELRYAGIDGRPGDLDSNAPAHLIPWVSANWTYLFRWRGKGSMPPEERTKLRDYVAKAHKHARLVRFWATPEEPALWKELLENGVDLINTDRLEQLQHFLTDYRRARQGPRAEPQKKPTATNARPASNDEELRYWLKSMAVYHRFDPSEMGAALGMNTDEVTRALRRLGIGPARAPRRAPDAPLLVLPYPGGRHPRIGFRDGAVRPQRETKVSVFAPWHDGGYAVADIPEAIWFQHEGRRELLYLAHTHVPTVWDKQGVSLPTREWTRNLDGSLEAERRLPNKVAFGARVVPGRDGVRMELWVNNGAAQALSGLQVQMCVMLGRLAGFEDQTNDNKVFAPPLAACRDRTARRWILTGWEPCVRAWGNPPCPCLHSDPQVPDCPPGQTRRVRGWISFYEGDDIDGELRRLRGTVFGAPKGGRP